MSTKQTGKTSAKKTKRPKKDFSGSSSLFASMVDHIPDALIAMDEQFHITGWNAAAESIYGWKAREALGQRLDEFLQTGFEENGQDSLQAELMRTGSWRGEVTRVRKDGTHIWVWCSLSAVRNEAGEITGLVSISRDITERKQAEEKLRMSEALMAQAGKLAHLGAWMIEISNQEDLDANPLTWSDEVYFIFGYEPGTVQVTNEFFFEHVHPDDRQAVIETIQKALKEKQTYEIEHRILHARGIERVVLEHADILFGPDGRPVRILGAVQDITERKWALAAMLQSETHYRALFEDSPVAIWEEDLSEAKRRLDAIRNTGVDDLETYLIAHLDEAEEILNTIRILDVNRAALQMYEAASKQELIESAVNEISEGEQEHMIKALTAIAEGRTSLQWEGRDKTLSGRAIDISLNWSVVPGYEQDYSKVIVTTIDITRQQQAIRELQKNQQLLHEAQAMAKMGSWTADLHAGTFDVSPENSALLGLNPGVYPLSELSPLLHPSDREAAVAALNHSLQTGQPIDVQFRVVVDGAPKWMHTKALIILDKDGRPAAALGVTQDITERMLASEQIRISEARFRQLAENLEEAFWITDPAGKTEVYISPSAERIWGRPVEKLLLAPNAFIDTILPEDRPLVMDALERQARGERTDIEYRIQRPDGSVRWIWDRAFPILAEGDEGHLVAGLAADITERKNSETRIQQQVQRLSALSAIDNIISASLDIDLTLNVFLTEALLQLKVDAADVLLLNPYMQTLEFAAGQGFRTHAIQNSRLLLGEGLAGRAILERQIVHIPDLSVVGDQFVRATLLQAENFTCYYGLPLVAKGQLKGVLEIFHRLPLDPDLEWLDYLKTLAAQAAIAIDNAQLFENMQRSNSELIMAYDATIAGWSHAMDLRDKETEGHTRRVTQLTLRLAERMGISKQELIHIRRGALLHDIGKLGVPDHILLKPGKLTDEEWDVMRQHPTYAYEMLSTIHYLRPALDIPYCHHEKWDGTGYPQGLKGEQIPLAARIFAVVDVWDALHSDRPYRPGWPVEKIREYIREQSGRHFDPQVAEAFLSMMDDLASNPV